MITWRDKVGDGETKFSIQEGGRVTLSLALFIVFFFLFVFLFLVFLFFGKRNWFASGHSNRRSSLFGAMKGILHYGGHCAPVRQGCVCVCVFVSM